MKFLHSVGNWYKVYIMMHGQKNIKLDEHQCSSSTKGSTDDSLGSSVRLPVPCRLVIIVARFHVRRAALKNIQAFWNTRECRLLNIIRSDRAVCCLRLQGKFSLLGAPSKSR
jgi:hypothetical protein